MARKRKKPRGDWMQAEKRAAEEFDRNRARIEAGETFRSRRPSDYRRKTKRSDGP